MVDHHQTVRLGCWSRLVISKPKLTQVKHTHTRVMAGGIHIHTHCVYGLPAGSMAGLAPHPKFASHYGRRSELSAVGYSTCNYSPPSAIYPSRPASRPRERERVYDSKLVSIWMVQEKKVTLEWVVWYLSLCCSWWRCLSYFQVEIYL
jgi:hypothetical protein